MQVARGISMHIDTLGMLSMQEALFAFLHALQIRRPQMMQRIEMEFLLGSYRPSRFEWRFVVQLTQIYLNNGTETRDAFALHDY